MRRTECPREQEALDAVASRRWPERADVDLWRHVRTCGVCADLIDVAAALRGGSRSRVGRGAGPPVGGRLVEGAVARAPGGGAHRRAADRGRALCGGRGGARRRRGGRSGHLAEAAGAPVRARVSPARGSRVEPRAGPPSSAPALAGPRPRRGVDRAGEGVSASARRMGSQTRAPLISPRSPADKPQPPLLGFLERHPEPSRKAARDAAAGSWNPTRPKNALTLARPCVSINQRMKEPAWG